MEEFYSMKKKKLVTLIGSFCLILALVALPLGACAPAEEEVEPIVIGAPIPRASTYGQNGERAMILAVEEINDAGGVSLGGVMRPFKLEIIDTRDEEPGVPTSEVLLAIEKLILDVEVDILLGGPCMSECGLAALDLIAKHKIVHIESIGCWTPGWSNKTGENIEHYKYSFRLSGHMGYYIPLMNDQLRNIKEEHGFNKMYITVVDAAAFRAGGELTEKLAVADGWEIVGKEIHPIATGDFSMMLRDCKESGAQILVIWDYCPEALMLITQWTDLKVPALAFGFVGPADDPGMWEATKGKIAYLVEFAGEGGTLPGQEITPLTKPFFEAFTKRWAVEPRGACLSPSYFGAYLLKEAIERAQSLDADDLVVAIEDIDMMTIAGRLRIDKTNHQAIYGSDPTETLVPHILQWQDGTRVTTWPKAIAVGELKMPPWVK